MTTYLYAFLLTLCLFTSGVLHGQTEQAFIFFGDNAMKAVNHEEALTNYGHAINLNPFNAEALIKRSVVHAALGQTREAEYDMKRATSINPYANLYLQPEARKRLIQLKSYEYSLADSTEQLGLAKSFHKSFIITPQYLLHLNGDTLLNGDITLLDKAINAMINTDYKEAQIYLDRIDPVDQESALVYDLRGVLAMKKGDLEQAVDLFTKSIGINPEFVLPYHNRAIAYKRLGKLTLSENDFLSALRLNSTIAQIHFSKATLKQQTGDLEAAKAYYTSAVEAADYYPEAVMNYNVLLKASGEYMQAMNELNTSIRQDPEAAEHYYARGGLSFIYGEYDNAIEDLDVYLDKYPSDADALFIRGISKILSYQEDSGCEDLRESSSNGYMGQTAEIILYMCDKN